MGKSGIRSSRGSPLLCGWPRGHSGGVAPLRRSVCCRRWQQHFFGMRAAGCIRARPLSAFRLFRRSPRPCGGADNSRRGGKACAPVAAAALRPPREASLAVLVQQRRRAVASFGSRHLNFFVVVAVGLSAPTPPPRCPSPVALRPAEVGGACLPCGRLKPPPFLRPRPPINVWGRGLLHCPAGVSPLRRGRCCACAALRYNILCPPFFGWVWCFYAFCVLTIWKYAFEVRRYIAQ